MAAIRSGIPTFYKSTQFRSRLEARWAAFFDLIGLSFCLRPCGHHQSGSFGVVVENLELEQLWRRAGNDVQWQVNGPQRIGDVLRAMQ